MGATSERPAPAGESAARRGGRAVTARTTVVIATRNRRDGLMRTLRKLAECNPEASVVVVDNASTDGTVTAVRRDFPNVTVIALPRNVGAAARNVGVARADTPYVSFCDDDSWWASGSLQRAAGVLDAYPRLGGVVARTLVGPEQRPDPVNAAMRASPLPDREVAPSPRVLGFLACSVVLRRRAFTDVGGFSPLLFFVGEEKLLAYDLAAAGWFLSYVDDVVVHHHPSPERPAHSERSVLERRNQVLTAWMRRPVAVALRATRALAADAVRDPAARSALRAVTSGMPAAVRGRRPLPASVEGDIGTLEEGRHPGVVGVSRADAGFPASLPASPAVTADPDGVDGEVVHWSGPFPVAAGFGEPVTVVVMTRDRRAELLRTLERVTALPERPPVIVVDNGSTDGTAGAVAGRYPGVTLLRSQRDLGSVARNVAVRKVQTPYVAFCDDDSWWGPGALARAGELLDAHPDLACVVGRGFVVPDLVEDPIMPELRESPLPRPEWLPGPALLGIMAGYSVLRVRAFIDAGGFSPRLWLGGEEELLSIDLATRGWWMCWSEDVVAYHAPSDARDPRGRRRLGIRNTLWTTWLRRPPASALRRTATLLRSVPRDGTSLAAATDAVAGLPWVVRERRVVPPHVEYGLRLLEGPQQRSSARRYVDGMPGMATSRPARVRRWRKAAIESIEST